MHELVKESVAVDVNALNQDATKQEKRAYRAPLAVRLGVVEELAQGNGVLNSDYLGDPSTYYGNPNNP